MKQYQTLFLGDNFFSTETTDIFDENQEKLGYIVFKNIFFYGVEVFDTDNRKLVSGSFGFLANRWVICDGENRVLGRLKSRLSFSPGTHKYRYRTMEGRGIYYIQPPDASKKCEILNGDGKKVAEFGRDHSLFPKPVYFIANHSQDLTILELIIIMTGACVTQKSERSAASST